MEDKVEKFINLRQEGMSVQEFSLMFTKFSKYAPSLVSNPKDEITHFVIVVFEDLLEECQSAMLYDNMDISRLIVHAQQVEEIYLGGRKKSIRGKNLMKRVLLRVGFRFKTILG